MSKRSIEFETRNYPTLKGRETKLAGTLAEVLVEKAIRKAGFSVINCSEEYCKFDLLVNKTFRVEVKFSKGRDVSGGRRWSFMAPTYKTYDILALVKGMADDQHEIVYMTKKDREKIKAKTVISVNSTKMRTDLKQSFIEVIKGVRTPAKSARNKSIYDQKVKGSTFKDLSEKFGISEKRVKDIYYKELKSRGISPREYNRK